MSRRSLVVLATLALLAGVLAPTSAIAKSAPRFQRVDVSKIDKKLIPSLLKKNEVQKVILELAGKPVAVRQHEAGRRLTPQEKAAIRAQLRSSQDALHGRIGASGGKILGQYQDAYDGIKVEVRADRVARLAGLPGVVAVHHVSTYTLDNVFGVPYIGAPNAWQDLGKTGSGVKIGIIDTGIDYYHADFGGSGDPADFANADGTTLDDGGFPSAKVAGGYDFVGDAYDGLTDPQPDPDPLDCAGHGSHVAGTAAGYGVLSTGATYTGPYNASTISGHSWKVGPGVAPQATLYAYRVFGCSGSSNVVLDAINRAVADGMDVINMSLGAPFGSPDDPDAVASNNASLAGTTVVVAAGNSGPNAMIASAPASADRAISVAAMDASFIPGGIIDIGSGLGGGFDPALSSTLPITNKPVHDLLVGSTLSKGCAAADYSSVNAGDIVVVGRGICLFAVKGTNAQNAGASSLIVVNNNGAQPPGPFTPGGVGGLSIPVFIFDASAEAPLIAENGNSHTIVFGYVKSGLYGTTASFSSGGPRDFDDAVKPEITAPGVGITSTAMGTGTDGAILSGTSMATPHTAGVAALVKQAHPTWTPEQIKAAIIGTANATNSDPGGISPYNLRLAGSGVVTARRAVDTVGLATTVGGTDTLSYGYAPRNGSYTETRRITLSNTGSSAITYNLSASFNASVSGASMSVSPANVSVPAHSSRTVNAKLSISNAGMTGLPGASDIAPQAVLTARGVVIATPTASGAGRYPLRVPFLVAPRGISNVAAGSRSAYVLSSGVASATVPLSNTGAIHSGTADVYSWGLSDANDGLARNDIRAVGVQTFPGGGDATLVFAVNTYGRWGNASDNEVDIGVDTDKNGSDDFFVIGLDGGLVLGGAFDGRMLAFTVDSSFNIIDAFLVAAPINGSTLELPTLASDLALSGGSSAFDYHAASFSIFPGGSSDFASGVGHFDALAPALSQGNFLTLRRGATATLPVSVDTGRFAANPALGWMVVTLDDANGAAQADLVPVGTLP